jgi:hypothetical protein
MPRATYLYSFDVRPVAPHGIRRMGARQRTALLAESNRAAQLPHLPRHLGGAWICSLSYCPLRLSFAAKAGPPARLFDVRLRQLDLTRQKMCDC